ncbi:rod shape-determining protein MreC [Candidatus Nardonella dryophthoridicola]|uniref:Cell shape-determining protein MreC n=1 Tax=endosymbiont of Rhynchophorus ferrugineus TaxID=1972133 RepID=A0A2Z5TPC2_9GAMM|nr:rod shape-determining protein MreC [Candidatus Nardonella dryophthoridicola]BBA85069.1 cell shape-determining protein MreC [endosymbiont of Rhynchophorus ferrugineus]
MINRNIFYKEKNYKLYIILIFLLSLTIFTIDNKSNEINFLRNIYINIISNKIRKYFNYIENIYNYNICNYNNNRKLIKENNILKKEIIKYRAINNKNIFFEIENKNLRKILNMDIIKKYDFIISKVIYYDNNYTFIVINKGKKDNLYIGQPVIDENGIIGQITKINDNNSIISTILNNKNPIISKIARNNIQLILYKHPYYNNMLYIKKKFLLYHDKNNIKENDLLISTGLDKKYPEGYPIGKIYKIFKKNKELNILIKPMSNFDNLNYLIILK